MLIGQCQQACGHCLLLLISALCYYYVFHIITKSGLYGFPSKFQGMSGMAMGWDINSGVVKGCTSFARYVAINSNFHFFFIFFAFSWKLFTWVRLDPCVTHFYLYFEPKMAFVAWKLAKIPYFKNFKNSKTIKLNHRCTNRFHFRMLNS
jgi:hypothetical protein